jgi:hypothetical protein
VLVPRTFGDDALKASWYGYPAVLMYMPGNVAVPSKNCVTSGPDERSVSRPLGDMDSVTEHDSPCTDVTTLPPRSTTETAGGGSNCTPPDPELMYELNVNRNTGPTLTENGGVMI